MKRAPESYVSEELFELGIGYVLVSRPKSGGRIEAGAFLVDVWCRGVKDAEFMVEPEEVFREQILDHYFGERVPEPGTGARGRKLIEAVEAWARKLGLPICAEYKKGARIFGGIDPAECPENFVFGKDGKPCYVPGPFEEPQLIDRILITLNDRCGKGGFDYMLVDDRDVEEEGYFIVAEDSAQTGEDPSDDLIDFAEEFMEEKLEIAGIEYGAPAPENFASGMLDATLVSLAEEGAPYDFDEAQVSLALSITIWNLSQAPPQMREIALREMPEEMREAAIDILADRDMNSDGKPGIWLILDWRLTEETDAVTGVSSPRLLLLSGEQPPWDSRAEDDSPLWN